MKREPREAAASRRGATARGRAAREVTVSPATARGDRRRVGLALLFILATLVVLQFMLGPSSFGLFTIVLCLLVGTATGRLLLGPRPTAPPSDGAWARYGRLVGPAVFAAAVLPYLATLTLGFISDDYMITGTVGGYKSLWPLLAFNPYSRLYRGLHFAAWWLQYQLWGKAALGYHAINVAFHGADALLVYVLGRRLIGRRDAALVAALLFAVHPLHVEPVAWTCGQVDLQATLFALLSVLLLDVYLQATRPASRWPALSGACLVFVFALLTKESTLALPAVAVMWTLVRLGRPGWRRALGVGGAFGLVLAGYLVVRVVSFGEFGGYYIASGLRDAWFPTAPLRLIYTFFFPVVVGLFAKIPWGLGGWLLWLATILMAGLLFACLRGTVSVPGRRLAFYFGFTLVLSIPVWQLPITADLEGTRFAYLPTIALAWLCGEVAAAVRATGGRARWIPAATLVGAALLCTWYLVPWRTARRLADASIQSAAQVIARTPRGERDPAFFFEGLPGGWCGAQVWRHGFGLAVNERLARPALVQTVGEASDLPQEVMTLSNLGPGEYLYEWRGERHGMVLVRRGGDATGRRP